MIIKGGYITGTNSTRMHPIKNINIKKSNNWSRISVKVNNIINTVCNIGINVLIAIDMTDDYNITLFINNKEYYKQKHLFEFEVDVDTDDTSIIEVLDNTIYDG
jgi:hypothetical protein